MTLKDIFGVAVRIIGFWSLVQGAADIAAHLPFIHNSVEDPFTMNQMFRQLAGGMAALIIGGWTLLKADSIVRLVYGAPAYSPPPQR